jgi:hypothetical protein
MAPVQFVAAPSPIRHPHHLRISGEFRPVHSNI